MMIWIELNLNKLKLNLNKCKFMVINNKVVQNDEIHKVTIDGVDIESVGQYKYDSCWIVN